MARISLATRARLIVSPRLLWMMYLSDAELFCCLLFPRTWTSSIVGGLVVAGTWSHSASSKETNFINRLQGGNSTITGRVIRPRGGKRDSPGRQTGETGKSPISPGLEPLHRQRDADLFSICRSIPELGTFQIDLN